MIMIFYYVFLLFLPLEICAIVRNASVAINENTGQFQIYDYIVDNYVAYSTFEDKIFTTGWSFLEVNTNESFPDPIQAYGAGLVEGYLTAELIKTHWFNRLEEYCDGEKLYCQHLESFLQTNMKFIKNNIKSRYTNEYWHQVALTLEQLHGLEDGYRNVTSQPSTDVDVMGLLLFSLQGDLMDLEKVFKKTKSHVLGHGSCSALIKIMPNNKDIYFSHVTWTDYNSMLRILKKYTLKFHRTLKQGSPMIPGHTCTFSSYPGYLLSIDDFYLLSSGLAVTETTIENTNENLWKFVDPNNGILDWQRNIAANRLATDGKEWIKTFSIFDSGTYNNQFMILDYKKFQPGKLLPDGLFHILEQMPGFIQSADVTDVLRNQGYWASYNAAYFEDIFNMSGAPENVEKYGDFFSHDRCPRALIFKRDQGKVKDMDSLIKLMRYNDYMNDPLSKCNCTPPFSADLAISSRDDLNPANGTYPIPALAHNTYGGTDMKATTYDLFQKLEFIAISGPTYDSLPPFQWSKADFGVIVRHKGHPDLWQFKPILHKWQ